MEVFIPLIHPSDPLHTCFRLDRHRQRVVYSVLYRLWWGVVVVVAVVEWSVVVVVAVVEWSVVVVVAVVEWCGGCCCSGGYCDRGVDGGLVVE